MFDIHESSIEKLYKTYKRLCIFQHPNKHANAEQVMYTKSLVREKLKMAIR